MLNSFLDRPRSNDAPLRMFCFHHAGGGSSMYREWHRALHPHVSVWPVLLPGRASRVGDARYVELESLLTDLESELAEHLAVPHVFFGHSMGALVAYRLACRRRASGDPLPVALFLSAYSAPHLPSALPSVDNLDDATLIQLLRDVGGLPAPVLAWPEWLAEWLPMIRDDLRICASYQDPGDPPLACPMHVFGADADPLVSEIDLRAWSRHTAGLCEVRILAGDHFYFEDTPDQLFRLLRPLLRHYAEAIPSC